MPLQVIDPTEYPDWDELLRSSKRSTFFHSSAWATTLKKTYGFDPRYFSLIENGRVSALVPVMEIRSFLTGNRGVSLPFTDFCEPVLDEGVSFGELFREVSEFGKRRGWKYLELRGGDGFFTPESFLLQSRIQAPKRPKASCSYLVHTLDLTGEDGDLLNRLRDSTRRNIRKAQSQGVEIRFRDTAEAMEDFVRLNVLTRKRHGLPPQPWWFFRNFHQEIVDKGKGIVGLAYHKGRAVSANVFCFWEREAIFKYGASDMDVQEVRANNLLMWESMRWLRDHGFEKLCLGRTEMENRGLRQFKLGWGAREARLSYYCYDLKRDDFVERSRDIAPWQRWFFSKLPSPFLNILGSILYSHAA